MGLDIIAVSRVMPESPELLTLAELGLSSSEHIATIGPEEIERGLWPGAEPGAYWSGPGSSKLHHRIGSYTYYAHWREACWDLEPGPALSRLLIGSDCSGGLWADEAHELHKELRTGRARAKKIWAAKRDSASVRDLIGTWDQFIELSKIAADEGLMFLC